MESFDFQPPGEHPPEPQPAPAAPPAEPASPEPQPGVLPANEPPPPKQSAFDWLTEVLIPIAVFGLLASFFYYLLDVRGALGDPGLSSLRWVCAWFLLGTILTTRMRTRYGAHVIALPYMIGLAIAMVLFVAQVTIWSGSFVGISDTAGQVVALVFNYGLVALIWWIAGLVTRACTAEESFQAMDEEGILTSLRRTGGSKRKKKRNAPRHPGWVLMWTSLVALITFALGQRFIGASSEEHRRHAFWCMVLYSFFALVLLALTSLSALRMSARQRRIRVSHSITPVWTLASVLIVASILALAAAIPRMNITERVVQRISQLPGGWSEPPPTPFEDAPEWGMRKPLEDPGGQDKADEDEGARPGAEGNDSGMHPDEGEDDSDAQTGSEGGQDEATAEPAGSGDEGDGDTGQDSGEESGGEQGEGESGGGGEQSDEGEQHDGSETGESNSEDDPSQGGGSSDDGQGEDSDSESESGAGEGERPSDSASESKTDAGGGIDLLKQLLLWLLILLGLLLLALLIAYLVYRALKNRKNWPSFRGWLRSLYDMARDMVVDTWRRALAGLAAALAWLLALLRLKRRGPKLGEDGLPQDPFYDIFANRELAESLAPAQVVRHVYACFQAFGGLIGHPRPDEQTPYEYCRAMPAYIGGMPRHDADDITGLYVKAAYSPEQVSDEDVAEVKRIWDRMQEPIDQALAERKKPAPGSAASPA